MYKQILVALLFFSVILLPVIPVSADNPDDDDQLGYTEFSWVGAASTVELAGEWDWSNTIFMEENDAQPTNVLDLIATDSSPAEITDTLKSMIYAKAGEKIDGMKGYAAASLFGQEPEPTAEFETCLLYTSPSPRDRG